jgi:hypothetical protein
LIFNKPNVGIFGSEQGQKKIRVLGRRPAPSESFLQGGVGKGRRILVKIAQNNSAQVSL